LRGINGGSESESHPDRQNPACSRPRREAQAR
jgi:hypothetical protein